MKRFSIFLLSILALFVSVAQTPQQNPRPSKAADFPIENVQFWTGSGADSAVVQVEWNIYDTIGAGLVWGVLFDGPTTLRDLFDSVAAYDHRFSFTDTNRLCGFTYTIPNSPVSLNSMLNLWCLRLNGTVHSTLPSLEQPVPVPFDTLTIHNGDRVTMSDNCAFSLSSEEVIAAVPLVTPDDTNFIENSTIDFDSIRYWIGGGTQKVVVAVNWAEPDTCLAWGVRFEVGETLTLQEAMTQIAASDRRFSFVHSDDLDGFGVSDIRLARAPGDTLRLSGDNDNRWTYVRNNILGLSQYNAVDLSNGDLVKWGDPMCAIKTDSVMGVPSRMIWTTPIVPIEPEVVTHNESGIDASRVRYWVGRGANRAIVAVNWAQPDTCLAWGIRFRTDSITLQEAMDTLRRNDSRFGFDASAGYLSDLFLFYNATPHHLDTLRTAAGSFWWLNYNGSSSSVAFSNLYLHDGDMAKWGDMAVGFGTDTVDGFPSTYVFETYITAIHTPQNAPFLGPFGGGVGSDDCDAISCESPAIAAWATGCTVTRGPQNLAMSAEVASYGEPENATGAVAMNDYSTVVSLGDGGWAVLTFAAPIADQEGPDFAVFENTLNDVGFELAFVEVSSDGNRFVRFPATSLTQTDVQCTLQSEFAPTFVHNLAGKHRLGYGTPFDLAELRDSAGLDITHITHVRIVDVVGSINPQLGTRDAYGHLVNDPYPTHNASCGFDLAGVAVLQGSVGIDEASASALRLYPNPAHTAVTLSGLNEGARVQVYDLMGREHLATQATGTRLRLDIYSLPAGHYLLKVDGESRKLTVR